MSGLFGSAPKPPPPPPPPAPAPTIDEARDVARKREEMLRRRGRAATMLSEGSDITAPTATKKLLGE